MHATLQNSAELQIRHLPYPDAEITFAGLAGNGAMVDEEIYVQGPAFFNPPRVPPPCLIKAC